MMLASGDQSCKISQYFPRKETRSDFEQYLRGIGRRSESGTALEVNEPGQLVSVSLLVYSDNLDRDPTGSILISYVVPEKN